MPLNLNVKDAPIAPAKWGPQGRVRLMGGPEGDYKARSRPQPDATQSRPYPQSEPHGAQGR